MGAFDAELDFVFRTLRRFGMSAADAEDVAQDVFVVMLRRWGDYDARRPLRPWLLGITNRVALHHLRRAARETPSGLVDREDEAAAQEEAINANAARQMVARALAELKDKQREVLVLHELEGVPMASIAQSTGQPLQTLYSRLKSAHRAFARAIRRMEKTAGNAVYFGPGLGAGNLALGDSRSAETARPWLDWLRADAAPVPPGLRDRVLSRLSKVGTPGPIAIAAPTPAGGGLAYATLGALVLSVALALISGARLLAADQRPGVSRASAGVSSPARLPSSPPARLKRALSGPRLASRAVPRLAERRALSASELSNVAAGLAGGLVGYWRFDENVARRGARDVSGHGGDCQLRGRDAALPSADASHQADGPSIADGELGAALSLRGGTWLECPGPRSGGQGDNRLSIALWVRPRQQHGYRSFVSRQLGNDHHDHFFFGMHYGQVFLTSDVFGGRVMGPVLPRGQWAHVAAVFNDGAVVVYVNGVEVGRDVGLPTSSLGSANPILVGAGANGPSGGAARERFRGLLDELVIYDRALSSDEIHALATGTQPRLPR